MKIATVFIFLFLFLFPLASANFSVALDTVPIISLFSDAKTVKGELNYTPFSDLKLSLSSSINIARQESFEINIFELSLSAFYFPFEDFGFYTGVSLERFLYLWGLDAREENFLNLIDVAIGYEFRLHNFLIEPRLTITEPGAGFGSALNPSTEPFFALRKYSLSLYFGYSFNILEEKNENKKVN